MEFSQEKVALEIPMVLLHRRPLAIDGDSSRTVVGMTGQI
jgi:hypothetical protein